jgi:hypothetical protein
MSAALADSVNAFRPKIAAVSRGFFKNQGMTSSTRRSAVGDAEHDQPARRIGRVAGGDLGGEALQGEADLGGRDQRGGGGGDFGEGLGGHGREGKGTGRRR